MTLDLHVLSAAYFAWKDPRFAESAITYGLLSPEEDRCAPTQALPPWWPPAAEAVRHCLASERSVVLCTGLSTQESYAAVRTQCLSSYTRCTIVGPASTSEDFQSLFVGPDIGADPREPWRERFQSRLREHCTAWARSVARRAAESAPCILLMPASMEFTLKLCEEINSVLCGHEVTHVSLSQLCPADANDETGAAHDGATEGDSDTLAEARVQRSAESLLPMPDAPELGQDEEVSREPRARAHKTRSAQKKRRFAFWRYCSAKSKA